MLYRPRDRVTRCAVQAKEQSDKDSPVTDDAAEWRLNTEQDQHGWTNGVRLGDGDGTVPVISTGLLCRRSAGYRHPILTCLL